MSLTIADVTLTYPDGTGRVTALDHVDLEVPTGTVTAAIGPSGSGKSSLLAVAATLLAPDSGEVTVAGIRTNGMSRARASTLRRERIGIVFQQPNLIASLTAAEQLQVVAHLDGRSPRAARRRAAELLDAVGLSAEAGRRPHELSGGQRQRINIARALMNEPSLLVVDEPTSALDHERGAAILALLCDLTARHGAAMLLATHDHTHLHRADQVVALADGRLESLRAAPRT